MSNLKNQHIEDQVSTSGVDRGNKNQPEHEKVVQDTKQPPATNQPIRKTDPSHHAFADDEEE